MTKKNNVKARFGNVFNDEENGCRFEGQRGKNKTTWHWMEYKFLLVGIIFNHEAHQ